MEEKHADNEVELYGETVDECIDQLINDTLGDDVMSNHNQPLPTEAQLDCYLNDKVKDYIQYANNDVEPNHVKIAREVNEEGRFTSFLMSGGAINLKFRVYELTGILDALYRYSHYEKQYIAGVYNSGSTMEPRDLQSHVANVNLMDRLYETFSAILNEARARMNEHLQNFPTDAEIQDNADQV